MKSATAFVSGALLLTACDHRDSARPVSGDVQTRQALLGTWSTQPTGHLVGVITLRADGACSGGWTNLAISRGWGYEGEWGVVHGAVEMKVTNTSSWNYTNTAQLGMLDRFQILRIDDREMVEVSVGEEKQTNIWTRGK